MPSPWSSLTLIMYYLTFMKGTSSAKQNCAIRDIYNVMRANEKTSAENKQKQKVDHFF